MPPRLQCFRLSRRVFQGDADGQPSRIMDEIPMGDVQIDRRLGRLNMAATGIKYDIFISYRRSDRELVASVVRRLEARGVGGIPAGAGPRGGPSRRRSR